jgi:hypothetical protein
MRLLDLPHDVLLAVAHAVIGATPKACNADALDMTSALALARTCVAWERTLNDVHVYVHARTARALAPADVGQRTASEALAQSSQTYASWCFGRTGSVELHGRWVPLDGAERRGCAIVIGAGAQFGHAGIMRTCERSRASVRDGQLVVHLRAERAIVEQLKRFERRCETKLAQTWHDRAAASFSDATLDTQAWKGRQDAPWSVPGHASLAEALDATPHAQPLVLRLTCDVGRASVRTLVRCGDALVPRGPSVSRVSASGVPDARSEQAINAVMCDASAVAVYAAVELQARQRWIEGSRDLPMRVTARARLKSLVLSSVMPVDLC